LGYKNRFLFVFQRKAQKTNSALFLLHHATSPFSESHNNNLLLCNSQDDANHLMSGNAGLGSKVIFLIFEHIFSTYSLVWSNIRNRLCAETAENSKKYTDFTELKKITRLFGLFFCFVSSP